MNNIDKLHPEVQKGINSALQACFQETGGPNPDQLVQRMADKMFELAGHRPHKKKKERKMKARFGVDHMYTEVGHQRKV